MKAICSTLLVCGFFLLDAAGQGTVQFDNLAHDTPIFGPNGEGLGPEARVQLFWDGTWFGDPTPFETLFPGYFFAGIVETPGFSIGSQQVFLVRAWIGDSFETAPIRGQVLSEPTMIIPRGAGRSPHTVRFESFTIPEPSVSAIALVSLGLLLFRRNKAVT